MRSRLSVLAVGLFLYPTTACQTHAVDPGANRDVKTSEPFPPPYVETYQSERGELSFVAAKHQGGYGSTHETIDVVWREFNPSFVLLEGFASGEGINPQSQISRRARCADVSSKKCDEGSYAISLAMNKSLPFLGGEPTELEIKAAILAQGYRLEDLLGFYVVRQIPEWSREGTLQNELLPPRIDRFIQDYARAFKEKTDFDTQKFAKWFREKTGHDFVAEVITTEDPAPRAGPGTTDINAISRAVELIRNQYILSEILKAVTQYRKVLVVYGQGHLAELRPELRRQFGAAVATKKN